MKLSIITICYNQPDIEETCESIVNQTFQDFEWIIIDGGSTDGTLKQLEKYKNRINILISEKDNGRYNAMNKGIKLAKGEWLNFMNGGDSFKDSNTLERIFSKNYDKKVLYGFMNLIKINGEELIHKYPENVDKAFFLNHGINHQASFIKRELFKEFGLYEENYNSIADWVKWVCFSVNGIKFQLIPEVIANFKQDGVTFNYSDEILNKNLKDKTEVIYKYYTESELKKLNPYKKEYIKFLGLKIIKILKYINKTIIYFLGIPIIKRKKLNAQKV